MTADTPNGNSSRFKSIKQIGEFIFAFILMVCGVVGGYLILRQLRIMEQQTQLMQRQTRVMQQQLEDAKRSAAESDKVTQRQLKIAESQAASLAAQAKSLRSQADSVRRQLDEMHSEAASMRTLADANKTIAEAANVSAAASKRVANTSAQQLEVTDRPWVRISMSVSGPITVYPRDLSSNLENGAVVVPSEVVLTNAGRSVANDVRIALGITFIGPRADASAPDADKTAIETCKSAASLSVPGKALFPPDKVPEYQNVFAPIPSAAIYPAEPTSRTVGRIGESVQLVLLGCATYTFSNTSGLHRTWFAYKVGKRTSPAKAPFQTWSFEIGKNVLAQDVFLQKLPYGGGAD